MNKLTLEEQIEEEIQDLIEENAEFIAIKNEKKEATDQHKDTTKLKENIDKEIEKIDYYLTIDFGGKDEYKGLFGKQLTVKSGDYTYEFNPFEHIKQKGRLYVTLGKWKSLDLNNSVQIYDKGDRCPGNIERSIRVHMRCGNEDELSDIREPNKCEYTMIFSTPSACTSEVIKNLKEEIKMKQEMIEKLKNEM